MLVVMRRFWIAKDSFDEFERLSREEIWPPIEAAGARILGMFRAEEPHPNDEVTEPCDMVVLLTQYTDRDHWRATRARARTPGEAPKMCEPNSPAAASLVSNSSSPPTPPSPSQSTSRSAAPSSPGRRSRWEASSRAARRAQRKHQR